MDLCDRLCSLRKGCVRFRLYDEIAGCESVRSKAEQGARSSNRMVLARTKGMINGHSRAAE